MYSFASLAAEQDALKNYQTLSLELDLENISSELAAQILNASNTLGCRNKLLDRVVSLSSEDDALKFCHAELTVHTLIQGEQWQGGIVSYRIGLKRYKVKAEGYDLASLTLNKMLLVGYTFKEVMGEHFLVITPNKSVRVTTLKECSCEKRQCDHRVAVKAIIDNRYSCRGLYTLVGT